MQRRGVWRAKCQVFRHIHPEQNSVNSAYRIEQPTYILRTYTIHMNKLGMCTSQREDSGEKVSHQIVAVSTPPKTSSPTLCTVCTMCMHLYACQPYKRVDSLDRIPKSALRTKPIPTTLFKPFFHSTSPVLSLSLLCHTVCIHLYINRYHT